MVDMPDRIRVAQDADGFWTCREAVSGSQEYVRADLYAALAARAGVVKVKPLEWRWADGVWYKAEAEFGGAYRIAEYPGMAEPFKLTTLGWWEGLPCGHYKTLEDAKAAAQADYERRILSAIEAASPLSKLKAENARLKAQLAEARKALDGLLKPFEGDDCRYDHHGYCQAHFLQEVDECCVKIARRALAGGQEDG